MKSFLIYNIDIIKTETNEIDHNDGYLSHMIFNNGDKESFAGVYAPLPFTQHSNIPESLGCELTDQGFIKTDSFQKNNVRGVFVCGDNSL